MRYRTAAKLTEEDGTVQVSTLIYVMGNEAENIYKSFVFNEREKEDDFETVLKKYDDYFVPQINIIQERAQFHQRTQRTGEKAERFIRALYELSENCDFVANRNENIRDRLVVGIRDKDLSRTLLTRSASRGIQRAAFKRSGDPNSVLATGLSTAESAKLGKQRMVRKNAADVAKQNIKT